MDETQTQKQVDKVLEAQLVGIAYEHLRLSSVALMVNSAMLTFILFQTASHTLLFSWFFMVMIISTYRMYTAFVYQKEKLFYSAASWKKKFNIALFVSTLLWGAAPFLFFEPQNYLHQAALIIVISGITAGAMSSLASLRFSLTLFLSLTLIPLIAVLFLQATVIHSLIAVLVSLYMVLLFIIGQRFHHNYTEVLMAKKDLQNEKEKLKESNERFKIIFKGSPAGILYYDTDLYIREVNEKFSEFLEAPRDFLIGLDIHNLQDKRVMEALEAPLKGDEGVYEGEYVTVYKSKKLFIKMLTSPIRDANNDIIGAIGIVDDITEKMRAMQQMQHQAKYDLLTDIPNRLSLLERVEHEIVRFDRHRVIFALLFLDLDHFKNINDSLGHDVGDQLLQEVAKRLKECVREEDMVARLGGDEFVVLLPDLEKDSLEAAKKAKHVAQKIHEAMKEDMILGTRSLNISTSIGITFVSENEKSANDLLKHADIAMYQAKKDGRALSCLYSTEMDISLNRRVALEAQLRNGLKNNEFEVYYQPIVELQTGLIIGAESLLRWNSKEFGLVSPEDFLPILEENSQIVEVGDFVLKSALKQFVSWQKNPEIKNKLYKISVNVSIRQFNEVQFIQKLHQVLQESEINPENLKLELVESLFISDFERAKQKMLEVRALGVGLSIDDFGTGYSSLSYLKQLPFTTLKIDREFIRDIDTDENDAKLVETILDIAQKFGLKTVAEGVESQEQLDALQGSSCDYLQGYYFSKPLPADQFFDLLRKG